MHDIKICIIRNIKIYTQKKNIYNIYMHLQRNYLALLEILLWKQMSNSVYEEYNQIGC